MTVDLRRANRFWTSAEDGMTHAEMGMFEFVTLDPVP